MTKAKEELGPCQVRSETHHPCPRPAVAKIWGMLFCERCAHEQEAYFAIGELTQEESHGHRNEPFVEELDHIWWERIGRIAAAEMERPKLTVGDPQ